MADTPRFVRLEQLQYDYVALLQEKLPASLDAVEGYWQGQGDALPLPDVADTAYYTGNITERFAYTILQKLPAITIEATSLGPTPDAQVGIAQISNLVVSIYVLGQTPQKADKLLNRYAAAIADVLVDNKVNGLKWKGAISVVVGEAVDLPRANYFKDAQITLPLRIGAQLS